ncbi:MAG: ribosomal protein S18-alanine N-acetyltransferase [Marinicella sp.]
MNSKLTFSHINSDDLAQVMVIEEQIYPNPWPKKTMQDCIEAGYQCIKGVKANKPNEIVCYAFLMIGFEESNLLNIGVNPIYMRQSMASKLLHHLLLISRINHAKHMWLEVRESNEAAKKLYANFNFKEIGRRKNYYKYTDQQGKKIKEHAILMSRKIMP